ncbi:40S ribosomal protein S3a [Tupaia chinensis]|uniref:40S ribosomal protein S3a n=1 Tax=Tupaia chinensis TaxID=246437 RepID=L9LBV0_TUPCH|nr:40S ribosomal protein S3a [Tupaia chinensis]
MFNVRNTGKTLVTRTQGTSTASDGRKGRVFEVSPADVQSDDVAFRKFKLNTEDAQGKDCLTNFHGMGLTRDKMCPIVKKWQTMTEAHVDVKTTDGYLLVSSVLCLLKNATIRQEDLLCPASTGRPNPKMMEIVTRELQTNDLEEVNRDGRACVILTFQEPFGAEGRGAASMNVGSSGSEAEAPSADAMSGGHGEARLRSLRRPREGQGVEMHLKVPRGPHCHLCGCGALRWDAALFIPLCRQALNERNAKMRLQFPDMAGDLFHQQCKRKEAVNTAVTTKKPDMAFNRGARARPEPWQRIQACEAAVGAPSWMSSVTSCAATSSGRPGGSSLLCCTRSSWRSPRLPYIYHGGRGLRKRVCFQYNGTSSG